VENKVIETFKNYCHLPLTIKELVSSN